MKKQIWYEVFEIQEDQSTRTIFDCDTIEEAKNFVLQNDNKQLSIDAWEMIDGIPKKSNTPIR
jgi:hypothetical protein